MWKVRPMCQSEVCRIFMVITLVPPTDTRRGTPTGTSLFVCLRFFDVNKDKQSYSHGNQLQ